jgi:hypothetical protein
MPTNMISIPMIFDNYDNPKLPRNSDPAAVNIRNFSPKSHLGSIIITNILSAVPSPVLELHTTPNLLQLQETEH